MLNRSSANENTNLKGVSAVQTTPGPRHQAAVQQYFERGSKSVVEGLHWKIIAAIQAVTIALGILAFAKLIPLKTVEVVAISKGEGGRLIANSTDQDFKPDQDMTAYFLNEWAASLVEISAPAWRKNVEKAGRMTVSVAKDQLREFLGKEENNAALVISTNNSYVRSYERVSFNIIKEGVGLIRFRTLSRVREGERPVVKTFALTANFGQVKPSSTAEAIQNPAGLYVTSFSVSEETSQK